MNVPLIDLKAQYKKVEKPVLRKLKEILSEQRLILGKYCAELETAIAGYAGVPHALSCANGTRCAYPQPDGVGHQGRR